MFSICRVTTSRALAVALVASVALTGCSALREALEPSMPIPDGTPPPAGARPPDIDIHAPGRTADRLAEWAEGLGATGIPRTALEAYGNAEVTIRATLPGCTLTWNTLAGLAWVESRHGTYGGSAVLPNGDTSKPIRGVPLDGRKGLEEISDTDGGKLDGDTEHDRAVGPFQFIPESWGRFGVDANGDGVASPDNIDDAAVAAARLLCATGGTLDTPESWSRAIYSYNMSAAYVRDVRDAAAAYSVPRRP